MCGGQALLGNWQALSACSQVASNKQQATRHLNLSIGVMHCGLLVVRHGYLVLGVQVNKGSVWSLDW